MNTVYGYLNEKTKIGQLRSKLIRGKLDCMAFFVEGEDRLFTGVRPSTMESIDALKVGWHGKKMKRVEVGRMCVYLLKSR